MRPCPSRVVHCAQACSDRRPWQHRPAGCTPGSRLRDDDRLRLAGAEVRARGRARRRISPSRRAVRALALRQRPHSAGHDRGAHRAGGAVARARDRPRQHGPATHRRAVGAARGDRAGFGSVAAVDGGYPEPYRRRLNALPNDRFLALPFASWWTTDARDRGWEACLESLEAVEDGREVPHQLE
jgi:hypothetical protein